MREIRDAQQKLALLDIERRRFLVEPLHFIAKPAHLGLDSARILARFFLRADFLADAVSLRLKQLEFRLRLTPLHVATQHRIHLFVRGTAPCSKAGFHGIRGFADESDIEHGARKLATNSRKARQRVNRREMSTFRDSGRRQPIRPSSFSCRSFSGDRRAVHFA